MVELNVENLIKKYQNSSQKWILPIPVIQNGQIKLFCFMNHKENGKMEFDAYYTYDINLLVLHNFLMEVSSGQAYWKYVRSKKPRTSFLGLADHQTNIHITSKTINQIINDGHTKYLLDLISKKYNEINYVFSIIALNEAKKEEDELANLGYDY